MTDNNDSKNEEDYSKSQKKKTEEETHGKAKIDCDMGELSLSVEADDINMAEHVFECVWSRRLGEMNEYHEAIKMASMGYE